MPKANDLTDSEYETFRNLIYRHSRISLGPNKKGLVHSRLSKRLRSTQCDSFGAYLDWVQSPKGADELTHLVDAISTNHTYFFRESAHYEFLESKVLPRFLNPTDTPAWSERTLRIWSAACSTGEEPYSIAMCIDPLMGKQAARDWQIHASDISTRVLSSAASGVFKSDRVENIEAHLLRDYFQQGSGSNEGMVRVKESIRRHIHFVQLNLLTDSYPFHEPFHVVFNRNVMIYFDQATQQELIDRMVPLIAPGGYLFIGHSETLSAVKHPLRQIQPSIFQKVKP